MPAYPFGRMPTYRQFMDYAESKGCHLKTIRRIIGPDGPIVSSYLLGPNAIVVLLPNIPLDEYLAPSTLQSYERALEIPPYSENG
jgi:hypothetical protein